LGTELPDFALPEPRTGRIVAAADFAGKKALLVMFICNHCPYVQHVRHGLADLGRDYEDGALGIVAISSNDVAEYPSDGPEAIAAEVAAMDYRFPYLYDEAQEVAKAFGAICTPDFFLYGPKRTLLYRGRMDDARPNMPAQVTGADLRAAIEAVLHDRAVPAEQLPSMGCSIKWRPGNAPGHAS
ncbi:MAG: thioredoxin family protein, partial [Actinobacteria bacterium]